MPRNPPWTREELILALDLYTRLDASKVAQDDPAIQNLSHLLNTLPFHPESQRQSTFRNSAGVQMTLRTFLQFDSKYNWKGLRGRKQLGEEIWNEYAGDPARLAATAVGILKAAAELSNRDDHSISLPFEVFPEGQFLTRIHWFRERNAKLVAKKKKEVLKATGKLQCEVCDFDFESAYGMIGMGFCECHHRLPLSFTSVNRISDLSILAIVCSNCHSILHRSRPWLTIEELKLRLPFRSQPPVKTGL